MRCTNSSTVGHCSLLFPNESNEDEDKIGESHFLLISNFSNKLKQDTLLIGVQLESSLISRCELQEKLVTTNGQCGPIKAKTCELVSGKVRDRARGKTLTRLNQKDAGTKRLIDASTYSH